jgi:hypothetical protein
LAVECRIAIVILAELLSKGFEGVAALLSYFRVAAIITGGVRYDRVGRFPCVS